MRWKCIVVSPTHKSAYFAEDSDEEEAPRRKRQMAEKAAAGELDEEEVSSVFVDHISGLGPIFCLVRSPVIKYFIDIAANV